MTSSVNIGSTLIMRKDIVSVPDVQPLIADTALEDDIQLSDGENLLTLKVTPQQYYDLLSSAMNGATFAFPDTWIQVIYPLLRSAQMTFDFCDAVSNCITNNTGTQSALEQYLTNNSQVIKSINTRIDDIDNVPIEAVADDNCDDRRFAGILAVVQRLDTNCVDFLEDISDTLRDIFERADSAVEAIPILGNVPSSVIDFAQSGAQDALDEYQVQSTQALLEQIACDIFCNTSGCDITLDDVITAYKNLLPPTFDDAILETTNDIISWIFTADVSSDTWFALVNLFQLFILKIADLFYGYNLGKLRIDYKRGSNTPDNTWTSLCLCVDTVCVLAESGLPSDWELLAGTLTTDFDGNPDGMVERVGGSAPTARIRSPFFATAPTRIEVDARKNQGGNGVVVMYYYDASDNLITTSSRNFSGQDYTAVFASPPSNTRRVLIRADHALSGSNAIYILKACFEFPD